jgi:hypothetical protein
MHQATIHQYRKLALTNGPTDNDEDFNATCYIAGPMRGYDEYNFPAFEAAADKLRRAGWRVFSPRENDFERGLDSSSDLRPLKFYMAVDLQQVCWSDAVFFLPGWSDSEGALLEFQVATYLGIPCYTYDTAGRITILDSDREGQLLGIDHTEVEFAEEQRNLFRRDDLLSDNSNWSKKAPDYDPFFEVPTDEALNASYPIETRSPPKMTCPEGTCNGCPDPATCDYLRRQGTSAAQGVYEQLAGYSKIDSINEEASVPTFDPTIIPPDVQHDWTELNRHPNSARFHEILHGLGELHDQKQADYGRGDDPFSNVRSSEEWGVDGWMGAMVRLNDKVRRLQSLATKGHLVNEAATDSFRDIAVYAIIAMVLFEQQHGRVS